MHMCRGRIYGLCGVPLRPWRVGVAFGTIAVLFNPFAPIYLERETWTLFDFTTAAVLLDSILPLRRSKLIKRMAGQTGRGG